MSTVSCLAEVRGWLFDLIGGVLPGDVAFGWDMPNEPADTDGPNGLRRSVWLRADITAESEVTTMPLGYEERWTQVVRVQCLPEDGSVDVPSADEAASELLDAIVDVVRENPRPSISALTPDGWGVVLTYGGFQYRSGRLDGGDGYAASFDINVNVEASRCS